MKKLILLFTFCACAGVGEEVAETAQQLQTVPGQAVSPASGYAPTGFGTTSTKFDDGSVQIACGPWNVPLTVPAGSSIAGIGAVVTDNAGSSGNTVKIELMSTVHGVISSMTMTSNGSGGEQGLSATPGTPFTPFGGELVWLRFSPLTASGGWATMNSTVSSAGVRMQQTGTTPFTTSISGYSTRASTIGQPGFGDVVYTNEPFVIYPVTADVGSVITRVDVTFVDSPGTFYEIRFTDSNDITKLVIGTTSAGNGSRQTLTLPLNYTVTMTSDLDITLQRKSSGTGTLGVNQAHVFGMR